MKHFHLFKRIALTCGMAAAALLISSCKVTTTQPTQNRAEQLREGTNVTIFSYNDASSPKNRLCTEAGPMPDNARRALDAWLRGSVIKDFSYAYPQYYVAMTSPRGKQRVWGICSDGNANLVGVLIPRDGVAAWDLPFVGAYKMYVYEGKQRRELSDAIMTYLHETGFDAYRVDARKATGLTDAKYLISKPKTKAEEDAERAAEEARIAAMKAANEESDETPAENAEGDEATEEEDSGDEEEETSEDEEDSADEEEEEEESSDEEEEESSEEEESAEEEEDDFSDEEEEE